MYICRGVINGKADKAAALPKFSHKITISETGRADYAYPLPCLPKKIPDYASDMYLYIGMYFQINFVTD